MARFFGRQSPDVARRQSGASVDASYYTGVIRRDYFGDAIIGVSSLSGSLSFPVDLSKTILLSGGAMVPTGLGSPAGFEYPPDPDVASIGYTVELTSASAFTATRSPASSSIVEAVGFNLFEYVGAPGGEHEFLTRYLDVVTVPAGTASVTVPVAGIVNGNDCIPYTAGAYSDDTGSDYAGALFRITSDGSGFTITRGNTTGELKVSVCLVEFTGSAWKVDEVTFTNVNDGNLTAMNFSAATRRGSLVPDNWSKTIVAMARQSKASATTLADLGGIVIHGTTESQFRHVTPALAGSTATVTFHWLQNTAWDVVRRGSVGASDPPYPDTGDATQFHIYEALDRGLSKYVGVSMCYVNSTGTEHPSAHGAAVAGANGQDAFVSLRFRSHGSMEWAASYADAPGVFRKMRP